MSGISDTRSSKTGAAGRMRVLIGAGGVLSLSLLMVAFMMASNTEVQRNKPTRTSRLVETVTVSPTDYRISIDAWGTVQAAKHVVLQPQVSGQIKAIGDGFEPGAYVSAGEKLLQIDPASYELTVSQRRADLVRARAELAQEEGRRAVAEEEFKLVGDDVTSAQKNLILREPQLQTARGAVAGAEAALQSAKLDLSRTEVRAPFNALILERHVNVGSHVGNGTALAVLAGTEVYWVELALPAASLRWIEVPGATVRLYHEQVWGNDSFREGRIIRLLGDLESSGRMARVLVEVSDPLAMENPKLPSLLIGAFLRAEIEGHLIKSGFAVDRNWLRDGDTLWVMTDEGRLEIRPVQVLYRGADKVYLRDGLKTGDRLVTSSLSVPADGMPLRTAQGSVTTGKPPERSDAGGTRTDMAAGELQQ